MLLRMYIRWAERNGFNGRSAEVHDGEEAGIKSATIHVKGHNAYGWLKTRNPVFIAWCAFQPYDSNARRIRPSRRSGSIRSLMTRSTSRSMKSDCRIDTYRSSGAGGQHVNTTDRLCVSRIFQRVSWWPASRNVRSTRNRAKAWDMLRARLYEQELKKREDAANAEAASKTISAGVPDPFLCSPALPAGEGSTHGVESTAPDDV